MLVANRLRPDQPTTTAVLMWRACHPRALTRRGEVRERRGGPEAAAIPVRFSEARQKEALGVSCERRWQSESRPSLPGANRCPDWPWPDDLDAMMASPGFHTVPSRTTGSDFSTDVFHLVPRCLCTPTGGVGFTLPRPVTSSQGSRWECARRYRDGEIYAGGIFACNAAFARPAPARARWRPY